MSVGHRAAGAKVTQAEEQRALSDARVIAYLKRKPVIDTDHDVPYLAGYSRDGRIVFIDRHLPLIMNYQGRSINTLRFLVLHETTEKALIDALKFQYLKAHKIAEHAEDAAVKAAGIDPTVYEKHYRPFIKADEKEKLVRVPPNLDLTPYIDTHDTKLLWHLRAAMAAHKAKHAVGGPHR